MLGASEMMRAGCLAIVTVRPAPSVTVSGNGAGVGVAEEAGLIVALDWWVLEQTCHNLLRWQRRFPSHAGLIASVNMNERQFADRDLIPRLLRVIEGFGLDPSRLALEITETIFRGGRDEAQTRLKDLKGLGVSLVVDDFGTGYSSLDSFATSAFDALKIDSVSLPMLVTRIESRRMSPGHHASGKLMAVPPQASSPRRPFPTSVINFVFGQGRSMCTDALAPYRIGSAGVNWMRTVTEAPGTSRRGVGGSKMM